MNDPILFLDLNKQQARIGKILKDRIDKVFSHEFQQADTHPVLIQPHL